MSWKTEARSGIERLTQELAEAVYTGPNKPGHRLIKVTRDQAKRIAELMNLRIDEYYSENWRDDDTPLQETSTGTTRRLSGGKLTEDQQFAIDAVEHHLLREMSPNRTVYHFSGRSYTIEEIRELLRQALNNPELQ